jgi:hypothetical protein
MTYDFSTQPLNGIPQGMTRALTDAAKELRGATATTPPYYCPVRLDQGLPDLTTRYPVMTNVPGGQLAATVELTFPPGRHANLYLEEMV